MVVWRMGGGGALRVLLKIPKESSNHRIKKSPLQPPVPKRRKAQRETEGAGEFHEKPVRTFTSCTHSSIQCVDFVWEAEVLPSTQMMLVRNESRTAGVVQWRELF